jgi:hypothetical protein
MRLTAELSGARPETGFSDAPCRRPLERLLDGNASLVIAKSAGQQIERRKRANAIATAEVTDAYDYFRAGFGLYRDYLELRAIFDILDGATGKLHRVRRRRPLDVEGCHTAFNICACGDPARNGWNRAPFACIDRPPEL